MRLVPKPKGSPSVTVLSAATEEEVEEIRGMQKNASSRTGLYLQALCHSFDIEDPNKLRRLAHACDRLGCEDIADAYNKKLQSLLLWQAAH